MACLEVDLKGGGLSDKCGSGVTARLLSIRAGLSASESPEALLEVTKIRTTGPLVRGQM